MTDAVKKKKVTTKEMLSEAIAILVIEYYADKDEAGVRRLLRYRVLKNRK